MFSLDTKMVRITSISIRKEKDEKGDEHTVCDIGISAPMENTVLDHFNEKLKPAFYDADDQTDMVSGNRFTKLKFPFPRFPWKGSLEGYNFVGHTGTGGPSEIRLNDTTINKVHFLVKDKAATDMDFIARARTHPDDVGKLSELLNNEVQISLVPPDEKKQFEIEQAKKKNRKALDDHFSGGGERPAPDENTGELPIDDDESDVVDAEFNDPNQASTDQDPDFREVDDEEPSDLE